MYSTPLQPAKTQGDGPLLNFSKCHAGILAKLDAFAGLPALLAAAMHARQLATGMLDFFRPAVFEHHQEEERELFPAVYASATKGDERNQVKVMIDLLTMEHRIIETAWAKLEPELKKVAKGKDGNIHADAVKQLVQSYQEHAAYEEAEFLPLAHTILSRNSNHVAALELSLFMRHAPQIIGHI
jgi:hypothetical protein